jgi:hypothetical protein
MENLQISLLQQFNSLYFLSMYDKFVQRKQQKIILLMFVTAADLL